MKPLTAGDVVATTGQQQMPRGDIPPELRQMLTAPAYALQEIRLIVVSTAPKGIVHIDANTEIELRPEYTEAKETRRADVTYDDLGGIGTTIDQLREMVELPLALSRDFRAARRRSAQGRAAPRPARHRQDPARPRRRQRERRQLLPHRRPRDHGLGLWREREAAARVVRGGRPRPRRRSSSSTRSIRSRPSAARSPGETEKRLVAQLLTLLDGLEPRQNLVVIAATNRPEALDEALRRPGRFDREIVIGVPDEGGRREILGIHTRGMPLGRGRRPRRAGAPDLRLRRRRPRRSGPRGGDRGGAADHAAAQPRGRHDPARGARQRSRSPRKDFEEALKRVQPSAMREVMVQAPNVGWDDIGGVDEARERLREGVELPLKHPDAFRRLGIRPAKGFLLYGPPGTGKTLLAKATAREAEANFIATKSSDLLSKWYGESEQQIARLFARARQVAPTVIFIDELDSLVPARGGGLGEPQVTERVVNTILAEMDGLEELQSVVVIGATNRPNLIDPALLRPGRFDELIYVAVPDAGRPPRTSSRIHTARMPLAEDVDLDALAARTERFTGADLEDLVRRAGLFALRGSIEASEVTMAEFEMALAETRASVTPEMEKEYEKIQDEPEAGAR